jgi:hypothetical protein
VSGRLCTTIIKSLLLPQAQACYGRLVPSLLHDDVVDDKAKYDRATRPQLIEDFKAWVAGDGPKSEVNDEELEKVYGPPHPYLSKLRTSDPARFEKRPGDPQYLDSPRYRFFIQVDQECLDSVLAIDDPIKYMAPLGGAPYAGWVNIVNSRWPLNSPIALEDAYRPRPNDPTDLAISADEAIPCS